MKGFKKNIINLSVVSLLAVLSSQAQASGYKLEFQSPSVLADGGDAAVVNDAGTNWYNSAGLVYVPQQIVISNTSVMQRTEFSGTSTAPFPPPPFTQVPALSYNNTNSGANSNPNALLPAFTYAIPFKDRYAFGLTVVPAWGLIEDYGRYSDVRYSINKVNTHTLDIEPSLAIKLNNQWSIGLGPDFHYFSVQFGASVLNPITGDGILRYGASNWGTGWHAGVLYRMNDATRLGLNYRSKIANYLDGNSDFTGGFSTNNFHVALPTPPTTTLSIYHDINPIWAIMGTIAYDQWSTIKYLYGQNIATPVGPTNALLINNYSNTLDFSVGAHYKLNAQWLLRGSLKLEDTPTNDSHRNLTFPDSNKLGVNLGARYTFNDKIAVDLLAAHVFTKSAHINDVNPLSGATSVGHVNTDINVFGASLVWNI